MTVLTTEEIRSKFVDYFKRNNHLHIPSSPLIPYNDPSLMFVNSGMVQFKNIFTGQETRDYKRAVTCQKSVRAGGKHNDLDNVGYTARHHTFFEMLGNFSFGDYFKEEAIYHAWNLLIKDFGVPKNKLYVTIYHTDEEAAEYWRKIANLPSDRIIKIKTNDNFWTMGDTGPCGPCSEIFYDHGEHISGGLPGTPEQDGDRFVEIWNMVFMQFEQIDKNTRIELPKKSIDTGMGLERMAAVMQGVHDNYDIDLFRDIINYAETILKIKAEGEARLSYRIIADHLRSSAFLIADGVMPSNEGRGYVLRRIMRRSMRHAHILGAKEPLIYKLLPRLVDLMAATYPELKRTEDLVSEVLKYEESRFKATLDRGLSLLEEETKNLGPNSHLSGDIAFKLYDTYGFPLDLTEDILKNRQVSVDVEGFTSKMQTQKERARKAWAGSGDAKSDQIWFDIKSEYGSTEFLGYLLDKVEGTVLLLIKDNTRDTPNANSANAECLDNITAIGEKFILIANQTPFYGESGGQNGDIGIINSINCKIKVVDTKKYLGSIIAHICILEEGSVKVGDNIHLEIDTRYRKNLRAHHSATHVLHAVLREVLGKSVMQKGSLVANDHLRFDFSYSKALSQAEIYLIEDKVNQIITDNSKVNTVLMPTEQAIENGAMALFGEKYDSEVRVVSMGNQLDNGSSYSFELCGGTHVSRTGDIGSFKVTSEAAVAAGIRRIEAICGEFVVKAARKNDELIKSILTVAKTSKDEVLDKITSLVQDKKEMEKELLKHKAAELDLSIEQIKEQGLDILGSKLIYKLVYDWDIKLIRTVVEQLSNKINNLVVVYINNVNNKLSITVAVSKNITDKFQASSLAKEISLFLDGTGGGGQATIAQAGGVNIEKLAEVKNKIISLLKG